MYPSALDYRAAIWIRQRFANEAGRQPERRCPVSSTRPCLERDRRLRVVEAAVDAERREPWVLSHARVVAVRKAVLMGLLRGVKLVGEPVEQIESPDAELYVLAHMIAHIQIRDRRYANFRLEVIISARANESSALRGASRESARSCPAIVAVIVLILGRRPVDLFHQIDGEFSRGP